jgi:hypothetical protein
MVIGLILSMRGVFAPGPDCCLGKGFFVDLEIDRTDYFLTLSNATREYPPPPFNEKGKGPTLRTLQV